MPIFWSIEDHLRVTEAVAKGMIPDHVAELLLDKVDQLSEILIKSNAPLGALRRLQELAIIVGDAHGKRNRVRASSDAAAAYVPDFQRVFGLSEAQAVREVARVYQRVVCPEVLDAEGVAFEAVKVALKRMKKADRVAAGGGALRARGRANLQGMEAGPTRHLSGGPIQSRTRSSFERTAIELQVRCNRPPSSPHRRATRRAAPEPSSASRSKAMKRAWPMKAVVTSPTRFRSAAVASWGVEYVVETHSPGCRTTSPFG